jgi:hypothetical protein
MKANIPYTHGDLVYLKNDPDQLEYFIVAFILFPNQLLQLRISDGGYHYDVYEFEVSREKDIIKATTSKGDEND